MSQKTASPPTAFGAAQALVGPLIAMLGAVLLLMSLFLEWYEPGGSAWTTFEVLDLHLALVASAGLALALAALSRALMVPAGAALGRLGAAALRLPVLPVLGGAALVMVLAQILHRPPTVVDDASRDVGAWLALAAAALLTLGGMLASLRFSIDVRRGVRDPGTAAPGEEVAYRPAPASAPPGPPAARSAPPPTDPAPAGLEAPGAQPPTRGAPSGGGWRRRRPRLGRRSA